MATVPEQGSALHIERLHNRYVTADGTPEELRARCEAALAVTLPEALAGALRHSLPGEAPDVWCIRRLDVNLSVDPEIEHARVAEVWAREISRSLAEAMQQDETEVLHFPDRASYLAHFLLDLAEGSAWDRWYYSPFDGLRMLPTSAAIRAALCDRPETGLRALHSVGDAHLRAIVKALSAADAGRVLSQLGSRAGSSSDGECAAALSKSWPGGHGLASLDLEAAALLLFAHASRDCPELAGVVLRDLALSGSFLARWLAAQPLDAGELLDALRARNRPALYGLAGAAAERLVPLLDCSEGALALLLPRIASEPEQPGKSKPQARFTSFGGIFLLFPVLDEFPFEVATFGWPDLQGVGPAAMARFLMLAKCFGRERFAGCVRDPLVRDLLGVPPEVSADRAAGWLRTVPADRLVSFLRANTAWHLERGFSGSGSLVFTTAAHKGAPIVLLLDEATGVWWYAGSRADPQGPLEGFLREWPQPSELKFHPSLEKIARERFPGVRCDPLAPGDPAAGSFVERVASELAYLEMPRELRPARFADLCLATAAQGILRRFASRLSGFAKSSPGYLNRNVLDMCAAMEETEERRVVSLSRPPLHMVLAMAGLNRCEYRLSWLDARPIAVFTEG